MSRDKCTVPAKKNDVMQVKYIIYQVYMIGPLQQREWVIYGASLFCDIACGGGLYH